MFSILLLSNELVMPYPGVESVTVWVVIHGHVTHSGISMSLVRCLHLQRRCKADAVEFLTSLVNKQNKQKFTIPCELSPIL